MQMLKGLIVVAALSGVTSAAEDGRNRGALPFTAHEQLVELGSMSCNKSCTVCGNTAEHKNEYGGTSHEGAPHGCAMTSLDCASLHACTVSFNNGPMRIEFLASEASVAQILESVPERNRVVVPERGVIQLLADCGTVIAQIPIAPHLAAEAEVE